MDAAEQAFDGEEIAVRVAGGHFDEKRAFAAAQIEFEWAGFGEEGIRVEAFKKISGPEKDVLCFWRQRFFGVFGTGVHWENLQCEPRWGSVPAVVIESVNEGASEEPADAYEDGTDKKSGPEAGTFLAAFGAFMDQQEPGADAGPESGEGA